MTYADAEILIREIESKYGPELSRQLLRTYLKEYIVGFLDSDRIIKSLKELTKETNQSQSV